MISRVKRRGFISVPLRPARAISARWREVTINQKLTSTFRLGGRSRQYLGHAQPLRQAAHATGDCCCRGVGPGRRHSPFAAQSKGGQQASPPRVIVVPNDIYRPPPAPPERYVAPPRSGREISPPMPRPEPLPPMAPRIGN